jgi:hypothetical protein
MNDARGIAELENRFRNKAIEYVNKMCLNRLRCAVGQLAMISQEDYFEDWHNFVEHKNATPLDDFDYEMSIQADENLLSDDYGFVRLEKMLEEWGITEDELENFEHEELQYNILAPKQRSFLISLTLNKK